MSRDTIFSTKKDLVDFEFDENVVRVFPDMINRSVPGYQSVIQMMGLFASEFVKPDTNVFDLGSSLGATALSIYSRMSKNAKLYAVDNSEAMVSRCKEVMSLTLGKSIMEIENISVIQRDITDQTIENATLVSLNFTLQFIDPSKREFVLEKIYSGLNKGGALILSEKVETDNKNIHSLGSLHRSFKKLNGYSVLEIAQKRDSLMNSLIPETQEANIKRLKKIGFNYVAQWFQCLNFCSFIAVK